MRRRVPKVLIVIPAIAFGMVLAWCMPQKFLLVFGGCYASSYLEKSQSFERFVKNVFRHKKEK